MIALFNSARAENGVGPVTQNGALTAAAEPYADLHYQAGPYQLSHQLDGGPGDRAQQQGYNGSIGEILVTANGSPQTFLDIWMGSPVHSDIILDRQYTHAGVGCYQGLSSADAILCVAMFGG